MHASYNFLILMATVGFVDFAVQNKTIKIFRFSNLETAIGKKILMIIYNHKEYK